MYSMYLYMKIFMIKNPPSPLFGGSSSNTFEFGKSWDWTDRLSINGTCNLKGLLSSPTVLHAEHYK
jgi:hypothetical protein